MLRRCSTRECKSEISIMRSVVRVLGKRRGILIRNLQAKPTRFLEISAELFRSTPFPLAMIVVLVDSGVMKLVDDGVEVIVGNRKSEMTGAVSRFRHLAELGHLVQDNPLIGRNADHRHAVLLFEQLEVHDVAVKVDALAQISRIEVQVRSEEN